MSSDRQQFAQALDQADQLQIVWCPIAKIADSARLQKLENDGAARVIKPQDDQTGESLAQAVCQLVDERFRAEVSDFFGVIWNNVRNMWPEYDSDPMLSASFSRMLFSDELLFPDGAAPAFAVISKLLLREPKSVFECYDPTLTFGIFLTGSRVRDWDPDISVRVRYAKDEVISLCRRYTTDLYSYLCEFCDRMEQECICVMLDDCVWLVYRNGKVENKGQMDKWRLKTTKGENWCEQLDWLIEILNSRLSESSTSFVEELEASGGNLGATMLNLRDQPGCLEIWVSGRAKFLFSALFKPELSEKHELIGNAAPQDLILMDVDGDSGAKEVLYARFDSNDPEAERCLCGWQYPAHPSETDEVVSLRAGQSEWIGRMRQSRADEWDWRLLSSPHFYFAADPDALKTSSPSSEHLGSDEEARTEARRFFGDLYDGFFLGQSHKQPLTLSPPPP